MTNASTATRDPRVWKFWGTLVWGLVVFAAMGIGQITLVAYYVWTKGGPVDGASPPICRAMT